MGGQQPPKSPGRRWIRSQPAGKPARGFVSSDSGASVPTKTSRPNPPPSPGETRIRNKHKTRPTPQRRGTANPHDPSLSHPHLATEVAASTGGGAAAMVRLVHRAAATSRCNGHPSPSSHPRQSDLGVYDARCEGDSKSTLLYSPRLLLRLLRLRRICSPRDEEGGDGTG